MKHFSISEKVVKEVVKMLIAYRDETDAQCARTGCMCDLRGKSCSQSIREVLLDFESGLCVQKE